MRLRYEESCNDEGEERVLMREGWYICLFNVLIYESSSLI